MAERCTGALLGVASAERTPACHALCDRVIDARNRLARLATRLVRRSRSDARRRRSSAAGVARCSCTSAMRAIHSVGMCEGVDDIELRAELAKGSSAVPGARRVGVLLSHTQQPPQSSSSVSVTARAVVIYPHFSERRRRRPTRNRPRAPVLPAPPPLTARRPTPCSRAR